MGAILGRIALDGRPQWEGGAEARFARAFENLRPGGGGHGATLLAGAAGYGRHDLRLGQGPAGAAGPLVDGDLVVLADATLYGRDDLARALGLRGADHADAELILRAWRRWGPDCLAHLNGDFGLAIHDRARGEIFLARDHVGARPLYWTRRGGEVLFATLLAGLRAFDDLDWPLDTARIARYLCNPLETRFESFLQGVAVVAPGEWLRIDAGGVARGRWWDPLTVPIRPAPATPAAARDAAEGLRALTEAAVRDRLPAAGAVGAHFSGGIDSTLVTIIAAQALQGAGRNLAGAYAWCPPVGTDYPDMGPGDERRIIAARCRDLGVPARWGGAGPEDFEALLARPAELEGVADLVDEFPVLARARDDGIRVMLSGWGGDEAISTHAIGHAAWLLRRGRPGAVLGLARRWGGGLRRPHRVARALWQAALVPLLPDALYRHADPFVDLYPGGAFPAPALRALDAGPEGMSRRPAVRLLPDADRYMRGLLANGHVPERMATWAAWGAEQGLVYRYPLTDRRVLEHMLALPHELRFGDGVARRLVNQAFADLLPGGLKKDDPANEKRRADSRRAWQRQLAEDARRGRFDAPCPWLDMDALRGALVAGGTARAEPQGDSVTELGQLARILVALRVRSMHDRAMQGGAARPADGG